jgi:hypothetical protein
MRKRFTENERMLDLLILQIMQGPYENVREYLTRLAQTATHKNISEHTLLAVGINDLRPDIRKISLAGHIFLVCWSIPQNPHLSNG